MKISLRRAARAWMPVVASALLLYPAGGAAQDPPEDGPPAWAADPFGDVAYLSINAVLGGLTAGLWQELSGGSFGDAFAEGALGGSVVYAGKRLAAETFFGAGFLGRGVSSVGSSVVRNAADGRNPLERVVLPLGPLRLYARGDELARPRLEVDLRDLYWTVYGLAEGRLSLDLAESLSSGAPVFRSDRPIESSREELAGGLAAAGVIFLGPVPEGSTADVELVLPHERAHVVQHDFVYQAWFRPLEDRLARELPWGGFHDRVDYDLIYPGLVWLSDGLGWIDTFRAPGEAEADFLGER